MENHDNSPNKSQGQDIIKDLPIYFVGKGLVRRFKFCQICVTNHGFIYEVNTGDRIYYEVFRKRLNHRFACVSYPRSKAFGIWASTTPDLDRAKEILREEIPTGTMTSEAHTVIVSDETQVSLFDNYGNTGTIKTNYEL